MLHHRITFAAILTFALAGCATTRPMADAMAELLALNQSYDAALRAGDSAALDRLGTWRLVLEHGTVIPETP
jgi:hypothetical protein